MSEYVLLEIVDGKNFAAEFINHFKLLNTIFRDFSILK